MIGEILALWFFASVIVLTLLGLISEIREWLDERKWAADVQRLAPGLALEAIWDLPAQTPPHETEAV